MTGVLVAEVWCDGCGLRLQHEDHTTHDLTQLRFTAQRRADWTTERHSDGVRDFCPACSNDRKAQR